MILINLLPHREARRQRRKQIFYVGIGASVAAGVLILGGWYAVMQALIGAQQVRNNFLTAEIRKLEAQIKDIENLRAEIDSLRARQQAVESLQAERNMPVRLLDELARQTPEGVYLTSLRQTGTMVALTGMAQSNERVSEMLRNTAYHAQWLLSPDLVEIKATTTQARRLYDFSMRVPVKSNLSPAHQVVSSARAPASRGTPTKSR